MAKAKRNNPTSDASEATTPPADKRPSWWRRCCFWNWKQDEPTEESTFTRWRWWRRWFGQRCERVVAAHLRRLNYTLLASNVRAGGSEIDLIALDEDMLVIVEVRATSCDDPMALLETALSVDERKQERLTRAALAYLSRHRALGQLPVRFDVILVTWPPHWRGPLIQHIPGAFEAKGKFQFFS